MNFGKVGEDGRTETACDETHGVGEVDRPQCPLGTMTHTVTEGLRVAHHNLRVRPPLVGVAGAAALRLPAATMPRPCGASIGVVANRPSATPPPPPVDDDCSDDDGGC